MMKGHKCVLGRGQGGLGDMEMKSAVMIIQRQLTFLLAVGNCDFPANIRD